MARILLKAVGFLVATLALIPAYVLRVLILSLIASGLTLHATAATDTVTSLADDGSAGTLRSVIAAAAPGDTITFSVTGAITLNCPPGTFTGSLVINQNLTISGPGAASLSINGVDNAPAGVGACPVFVIPPGVTANISGVTIAGGFGWSEQPVPSNVPNPSAYYCGGIGNLGTLTVSNIAFSWNFGETAGAICNLGGTITVNGSTFSHNGPQDGTITNSGGTLIVNNSTFSTSYGPTGGAILNVGGGNVIVNSSLFSNNSDATIDNAAGATAAVYNSTFAGNSAGISNSGMLSISNSTISGNSAAGVSNVGSLTVVNSTISGNAGYGIINTGGTAGFVFSTLSNNYVATSPLGDAGGCAACSISVSAGTLTLKNTIVATTATPSDGPVCAGTIVDGGGNLSWPDASCPGLNADPVLGPLQNNGGTTQTNALLPGSRALDAVPSGQCTDLAGNPVLTDQRGVTRPQGPACDIGAYERVESGPGPVSTTTAISSSPNSSDVGQSVVLSAIVSSWAGGTPTGTVTFEFGYGGIIGTATLNAGQASLNYTFHVAATASIVAVYSGDSHYLSSASATLSQIIVPSGIQQAKMIAQDGAAGNQFGSSVALSDDGTTALVSAPYKNVGSNTSQGAVYVFTNSGAGWTLQQELTGADGAVQDFFGQSVALSSDGNTALIGARGKGVAYVFSRTNGTWTQTQELTGSSNDGFGWSVALSGDGSTALVGAIATTISSSSQGAVYVFTSSGGGWNQQQELIASDAASDHLGVDVALSSDGNTALLGTQARAAYVFTRSGTTWNEQQELLASNGTSGDIFGFSVALSGDGNTALVGASDELVNGSEQGSVYVFLRTGTSWNQQQELSASDGASSDEFGVAVALSRDGETALIGADTKQIGSNTHQGAAYKFTNSGGSWSQQQELTAWDGTTQDTLGASVALSSNGNAALVGAPGLCCVDKQGAVYVFANRSIITITSSPNPSPVGQPVTLGATVAAQSGSAIPTGTVIFSDGTVTLAAVPLLNGIASMTTSALAIGTHSILASYSGDSNFATSSSTALIEQVLPSSTQTALVSSLNPSTVGQPTTFTATVTGQTSLAPSGTVTFTISGNKPIAVPLNNGVAIFNWTFVAAGERMVTASYSGDGANLASTSAPLSQTVNPQSTSIVLTSSVNPSTVGQTVAYTAVVSGQNGGTQTGTVTFTISGNNPVSVALANGQAQFSWTFLHAGVRTVTAAYSGDANDQSSSSAALSQSVNSLPATMTSLGSSLNPSGLNQSVTYTANVTGQNGVPTGSITFAINGNKPVTLALSNGQASFSWTYLNAGTRTVTASYSGDANNASSVSPTLSQTVNP